MLERTEGYLYFDYAATAPMVSEALAAMEPYLTAGPGSILGNANPNSLSQPGREAFKALEGARRSLASSLGAARPDEIIFTSGATEADNAAMEGVARAAFEERARKMSGTFTPHVITSQIEHKAVLKPARRLASQGFEVTYLRPDRDGFISVSDLEEALRPETVLVSIQQANSEVGSIQAIRQLAAAAHRSGALFHTDAVQGLGKVPIHLREMDVDAASFSAHKIGGPYDAVLSPHSSWGVVKRAGGAAAPRMSAGRWASRRLLRQSQLMWRRRVLASGRYAIGSMSASLLWTASSQRWNALKEARTSFPMWFAYCSKASRARRRCCASTLSVSLYREGALALRPA